MSSPDGGIGRHATLRGSVRKDVQVRVLFWAQH